MAAVQDAMPVTRGLNFYLADPNLEFVCSTLMAPALLDRARPHLVALGQVAGDELDALAAEADKNPPVLRAWDQRGQRVDEVVRHPAYRAMERLAFERFGLAGMSHRPDVLGFTDPVPHVVKYALSYLFAQSEFGLLCPVNMTDSAARMLRCFGSPELQATFVPRLTATNLDQLWQGTQWMTEKTGGSDVGASTTVARRAEDGTWRLWGDKWFCSNADADLVITLARPEGAPAGTRGLGMFLVPRRLPDGTRNAWTINRLKDKLGSRSMATGEVTYAGAVAHPVGDLGRGFQQMMEMVNVSRLSNAMRSAAIMRRSVLEAVTHARGRAAFGSPLLALPLLRSAVTEMLLDAEAACSMVLNAAARLDGADAGVAGDRALFRILTPLCKYWITSRARVVAGEAMNVRGGNGYIEEWVNARLLRDSYLGAIWEGAASVVALDVQRAILKDGGLEAVAGLVRERLGVVTEPAAKPSRDLVLQRLAGAEREAATWPAMSRDARELAARPLADTAYHLVASSLLLAEGQALLERRSDYRKIAVAALYARRWLISVDGPAFTAAELTGLEALLDWRPVAGAAVPVLPGTG